MRVQFDHYPFQASCKFKIHSHIQIPISVRLHLNACLGLITAAAAKIQPQWKSQDHCNTVSNLCREDSDSYVYYLQTCTNIKEIEQLHAHMITRGFGQNIFLQTKLVNMYATYGIMENARLIFDLIDNRNVFLWNVMITGYTRNGYYEAALGLYYQMQRSDIQPDKFTFPSVLKACVGKSDLQEGKEIHECIVRTGYESDVFVATGLISMYAKYGIIAEARQVFDKMCTRDLVSWSAMIGGYAQNGYASEALSLYRQMQAANVKPNSVTRVGLLQACATLGDLQLGKSIHEYIIRSRFEVDVFVANSLVDMYAKCGSIEDARQVFDKLTKTDAVSWNAIIFGYAQNGYADKALKMFNQMVLENVTPDSATMISVLPAFAHFASLQQGKQIHGYINKNGFELDSFVRTALIDMYAKCGSIESACKLFENMPDRDVVSWNAMIAGYVQNGHADEALKHFTQMQLTDMKPNFATMVAVLPAFAHLAALQQGNCIHGNIIRSGFESDVFVGTALIDMYAKCGNIKIARQLFDNMFHRNMVTWSAMIAGYGMHGLGEDALVLFYQMQQADVKPNDITFVSVLSACSHAGLIDEGWYHFHCMIHNYCIKPREEHYACMVDLLGRAGHLDEAQDFIKSMPVEPGVSVWGALLGACRIHCNIELGERVAERLFNLNPDNSGFYVLLSNIYAAAGRWDDVTQVRVMMKDMGLKKTPGCSLIEVDNRVHEFFVGDRSHPQSEKIYVTLETLVGQMEAVGYMPDTNFSLHDVEDEVKKDMLWSHSEKLAIAFGLINTNPGTPLRITKNLRVCGDCHSATKFISKVVKREIIVRDAIRFHHFKDGLCSCGDYW